MINEHSKEPSAPLASSEAAREQSLPGEFSTGELSDRAHADSSIPGGVQTSAAGITDRDSEVLAEGENNAQSANTEGPANPQYDPKSPYRHYRTELRPGEPTDEELFARYQSGNGAAFLLLYDRYHSNLYAYCAKIMYSAGLDTSTVEDTFQEVFLRVSQYQHTFVGGEFRAWIFTIARHACLNMKKKGIKHRVANEMVGDAENLDEHASREARAALSINDDPLEALSKEEQTALLMRAIELLPETYREALLLSDFEGLTYDEIGKVTGTSLSTARIRVYRAKARLRKMLLPIIGDDVFIPGDLEEE